MSPVERLAKLKATPVPKKVIPTATPVPRQMVPVSTPVKTSGKPKEEPWDPDKAAAQALASAGISTTPNKQYPFTPLPEPITDPEVLRMRSRLGDIKAQAIAAGADKNRINAIAAGEPDPNRGFIGLGKGLLSAGKSTLGFLAPDWADPTNIPLPGTDKNLGEGFAKVAGIGGKKALEIAAPPLDVLGLGFRFISSTVKELGDEMSVWVGNRERGKALPGEGGREKFLGKGGFNFGDWYNQTFAGTFGLGDKYKANDPAIIAEAAQYENVTPEKLAEYKNKEQQVTGGEVFSNVKSAYANQLLGLAYDVGLDPLSYGTGIGGLAKGAAAEGLLASGSRGARLAARFQELERAGFKVALKKTIAEEAMAAAEAVGDNAAAAVQRDLIKVAEKEAAALAKKAAGDAPARVVGAASKRALASNVLNLRDEALGFVERAKLAGLEGMTVTEVNDALKLGNGPGTLAEKLTLAGFQPEEIADFAGKYADAVRFTNAITPEVIANIQKSGLAGIAGPYIDIIKGVRTPAQEALNVRGGYRVFNPLEPILKSTPKNVVVPGTQRVTDILGKLASDVRLGLIKSTRATEIFNRIITQTSEGGPVSAEDILTMRTALKNGTATAEEAEIFTRLLDINKRLESLASIERRQNVALLNKAGLKPFKDEYLNKLVPYWFAEEADWARLGYAPLSKEERVVYQNVRDLLDNFAAGSKKVAATTGFEPPLLSNYFPQNQTKEAASWMQRHPKVAEKLSKRLGVDRTWFVGNFRERTLKEGDSWFGFPLEADDIKRGSPRLNEIARNAVNVDSAGKSYTNANPIKFDFFDTNVKRVLRQYAEKDAAFKAFQGVIGEAPERAPGLFVRGTTVETPLFDSAGNELLDAAGMPIIKKEFVNPQTVVPALPPADAQKLITELGLSKPEIPGIRPAVTGKLSIEALAAATPEQLTTLLNQVKDLTKSLRAPAVIKQQFEQQIDGITKTIDDLNATLALMTPDEVARATQVYAEYGNLQAKQLLDELARAPFDLPPAGKKWSEYADYIKKGVDGLNPETLPDIGAQQRVAEMLQNAERIRQPEFVKNYKRFVNWYTGWSKANYTARPAFHANNAKGNVWQFIVAGGDPINGINGGNLFGQLERRVAKGMTVREAILDIVENPGPIKKIFDNVPGLSGLSRKTPESVREFNQVVNAIEEAYNISGNIGFGITSEFGEAVGQRPRGFLLRDSQPSKIPVVKQAGDLYSWTISKGKSFGSKIENFNRFGLFWDGLVKGYTPQEAAARVDRFLLNYQEFSKLDKAARTVFPFWTFMSRNAPLALQFSVTNPKAFAWYNAFQRNIGAPAEWAGGPILPIYEKDRGIFGTEEKGFGKLLPGQALKPSLPFPAGGENPIDKLISDPAGFLSGINPLFRVPVEAVSAAIERPNDPTLGQYGGRGYQFFTGGAVVPREAQVQGKSVETAMKYLVREMFTPTSPLKSLVSQLPAEYKEGFLANLLGIYVDQNEPELQTMQAIMNWTGLPFVYIKTSSQRREIERRLFKIARILDEKNSAEFYRRKQEQKDAEKNIETPTTAPSTEPTTWDPDKAAQDVLNSLQP